MVQDSTQPSVKEIAGNILLITLGIILPGVEWSLFGWMQFFLPLLAFFFVSKYGRGLGNKFVLTGCVLAFIASLLLGILESFCYSIAMIPAGYVLSMSGRAKQSTALSGLLGTIALFAGWLLLNGGYTIATGISPYSEMIASIVQTIDETIVYYQQSNSFDAQTLAVVAATLENLKTVVPLIWPGVLLSFAYIVSQVTMMVGNLLVRKHCQQEPWPLFRLWQLPDKLIWLGIIGVAAFFLLSGTSEIIAVNILILLMTVYCFQGLSICVFYMHKWNVPLIFRSFLYVMIILQSFGTIFLLLLGVFDTWFDFRKISRPPVDTESAG